VGRFTRDLVKDESDEEEGLTEYQDDLFGEFVTTVYQTLLRIDRRSYQHGLHGGTTKGLIDVVNNFIPQQLQRSGRYRPQRGLAARGKADPG